MASYSYSTLQVVVTADTRQMRQQIAREAVQAGKDAAKGVTSPVTKAAASIGTRMASAVSGAARTVTSGLSRAWAAVSTAASRAASAAASAWSRLPGAQQITTAFSRAWSAVSTAASRAASAASSAWSRVTEAAAPITTGFSRAWSAVSTAASRAASAAGTAFTRAANSAGSAVSTSLGRAFEGVQAAASRASAGLQQMFQGGRGGRGGGGLLGGIISGAGAAKLSMGALAVAAVKTGISYNTLEQTSRAAFTTVLGSAPKATKMMDDLMAFAKETPFPRQAYIEGAQQMVSFGISAQKTIPYLRSITDAVAATGGSAQTLSEVTLVMSQIQAAGKITGVDLMQFAQRGINAAQLIGDAMGLTEKQVRERITAGALDATKALDALSTGMEKRFGGAAENVRKTWAGTTDRIKGAFRDVGSAIVAPFIDPKGGGLAVEWGNTLATSLRSAIPAITTAAKIIGQAIAFIAQGIAVVVMGFNKLGPLRNVILALAAAWVVFNAVMAISPLGWVIIATAATLALIGIIWKFRATILQAMLAPLRVVQRAAMAVFGWIKANWPLLVGIMGGPLGIVLLLVLRFRKQLAALFTAAWNAARNAVLAAWRAIRAATTAGTAWVRGRVSAAWTAVRSTTTQLWGRISGAVTAAWARIKNTSAAAVTWVRDRVTAAWNTIRSRTTSIWTGTVNSIRRIFERIVEYVKAPIKTVVNKVIRPLIWGLNKLITKVGIPKIPDIALGYAHGGKVRGYGRGDKYPAVLEAGETVVTRRDSARPDFRAWARARGIPGYAEGGVAGGDAPAGIAPALGWADIAKGGRVVSGFGAKLFREGVAKAFETMLKPLRKLVQPFANSRVIQSAWLGKNALRIMDAAVDLIRGKEESPEELGGVGVAALAAEVMRRFRGLVVTSALRRGDPGYHGKGWARDLGGPVPLMKRAAAWMNQNMVSALLEGIFNPGLSVKNFKRVSPSFWGSRTWAAHANHIHMAARPGGPAGAQGGVPGNVASWRPLVTQMARRFGIVNTVNAWLRQIATESGGNPRAIQMVRDINWPHNRAQGLLQVIPPTFRAYAGPYRSAGPMNPAANIYAAMAYAIARYGRGRLLSVIGRGHGYAQGGRITEPIFGIGRSGRAYTFGENAPRQSEWVLPEGRAGRGVTVNVYPRERQSETAIAAAVSRRLAWAQAGGRG